MSFVAVGCAVNETPPVEKPTDLIPADKMIPLIIDLQVLESHYQRRYQRPNIYKDALDSASYFVFERHEVTEDRFERSYNYYAVDVPLMYGIYEAALDSMNIRVANSTAPVE